jgi:hypothetical protein
MSIDEAKELLEAAASELPDEPDAELLDLLEVLKQEFEVLHRPKCDKNTLLGIYTDIGELQTPRAALCLSGGGIRSASFSLGVIQALARHGLLTRFHYLSTVSGGGYIGSWLSAWRHHSGDAAVLAGLSTRTADPPEEVAEIRGVRANSNFITPKVGLTSADTWSGIALYVRNLFLNWFVLGPLLLAALTPPVIAYDTSDWAQNWPLWAQLLLIAAASLLLIAGGGASVASRPGSGSASISQDRYLLRILLPTYASAIALTLYAVNFQVVSAAHAFSGYLLAFVSRWALWGMLIYASSWLVGFAFGWRNRLGRFAIKPSPPDPVTPPMLFAAWSVSGAFFGLMLGLGLYFWGTCGDLLMLRGIALDPESRLKLLVVLGVAWVVVSALAGELLYIGLASYSRYGDMEREWLARSSGWLVAVATVWTVLALVVLFGFSALQGIWADALVLGGGTLSGIVTLVLASGQKTAATVEQAAPKNLTTMQIVSVASIIFLIFLATVLSGLLQSILNVWYSVWWNGEPYGRALVAILVAIALVAIASLNSAFVNVNRFSLHAVYRNRLVRAFLGSARLNASPKRQPDLFSGFDQYDNLSMSALAPSEAAGTGRYLFHVVNQSLNVVASPNLAWQERKAESFVMTPLACGNLRVGFRPTSAYANDVSLGTAMAISGAAVSPNQGYYSSPLVGFLMMLFNVRLGWWLGNPRDPSTYWREGPRLSVLAVIRELFGLTTDAAPYIYLSDGGHFEDLGLYEMIRRRCRFVVAIDAGSDKEGTLLDLGNAMRKIWIDFGAQVAFDKVAVMGRPAKSEGGVYAAIGTIRYPEGGPLGTLIYIKPGFFGTEPVDVRSYGNAHPEFPHDTTLDQWFTESQMESYRSLGSYILDRLCVGQNAQFGNEPTVEQINLDQFAERVRLYLGRLIEAEGLEPSASMSPSKPSI